MNIMVEREDIGRQSQVQAQRADDAIIIRSNWNWSDDQRAEVHSRQKKATKKSSGRTDEKRRCRGDDMMSEFGVRQRASHQK